MIFSVNLKKKMIDLSKIAAYSIHKLRSYEVAVVLGNYVTVNVSVIYLNAILKKHS